jgi:hypothetical protein
MNRSDIVVAKGRNELLVVYEVSQAGMVTCGVWLGHGVLTSEHRPEDLETVARPTGCPVHLGGVVWHARLHSLIHAETIEGDRVEGPVLNPGKPGRYNVPIEEVAAMAASHWLFWAADVWSVTPYLIPPPANMMSTRHIGPAVIKAAFSASAQTVHRIQISPGAVVTDHSNGVRWRVVDVDRSNAMVCVVPETPTGHPGCGTWLPVSQFSPIHAPKTWEDIDRPISNPYVSPFRLGDRVVIEVDGPRLGTVEAIDTDPMHRIRVHCDDGGREQWLPTSLRPATWRDEKPLC